MNVDDRGKTNLMADVGLVVFLTLMSLTTILVNVSEYFIWSLVYLAVTVLLMMVTYFYGLIPGLLSNLLFIFSQIVITAYMNMQMHSTISYKMALWLILPGLLCMTLSLMMRRQQELQLRNRQLRTQLVEQGAFDAQTNLRTMVAFVTDARVYIENNRQFDLPVTMLVFRIRYYQELQKMLSEEQVQTLLQLISNTLTRESRDNNLTYYLNQQTPTWGMILHVDEAKAAMIVDQLKREFIYQVAHNGQLKNIDTSLVTGVACWDPGEMQNPYDLMHESIRETEYDV